MGRGLGGGGGGGGVVIWVATRNLGQLVKWAETNNFTGIQNKRGVSKMVVNNVMQSALNNTM